MNVSLLLSTFDIYASERGIDLTVSGNRLIGYDELENPVIRVSPCPFHAGRWRYAIQADTRDSVTSESLLRELSLYFGADEADVALTVERESLIDGEPASLHYADLNPSHSHA